MHASKLIKGLKVLSEKELKDLKKFLKSNSEQDTSRMKDNLKLLGILSSYHPEFKARLLKKEKIYIKLYSENVYKAGKLEKQMTYLFKCIEVFIVERYSSEKRRLHELLTLYVFYEQRGLKDLADASIKKYQKVLEAKEQFEASHFYHSFLIEKEIVNRQAYMLEAKRTPDFSPAIKNLSSFFILELLELGCRSIIIHRFVYPQNLKESLVVLEALKPLLDLDYFDTPLIKVYYKAYLLLSSDETEAKKAFTIFEETLDTFRNRLPLEHLAQLSALIRNYCVTQYHNGNIEYLKKGFAIYKEHLKQGLLYLDGKLFPQTIMSLVNYALTLEEFDWVYLFLQNHREEITGTNDPEGVYKLNLANYFFHIKDYDKALNFLQPDYDNTYYKLKARRLEIEIYYELKHILLVPKIDAFKIYVYRFSAQKITPKRRAGNRKFIDLLRQIALPKTIKNSKRIDKLIQKINSLEYISEKEWLLQKMNELR